jgi:peptidoglycan/xylan/chitin deacetylase (PgdA/CDA1 family)
MVSVCAALTMAASALATLSAAGAQATAGHEAAGDTAAAARGQARAAGLERAAAQLTSAAAVNHTVVSFTFDDGDVDQMMAARVLHTYGLHGTFYIIAGAVGAPTYVTLPDLHTLAAYGDEIGGHTVSHLELPHITAAEARRQVCDGRDTLIRWGFHHVTSFAYPGGVFSPATEAIVRECGFNSARTVDGLHSPGCPQCTLAETIPPKDPYAVRVPGQVDGTWTLTTLEDLVVGLERAGGGWLPLVFHHICGTANCSSLSVRLSLVNAFAKWLAERQSTGTVVETVGQVIGGPVRPMVKEPPAPGHGVVNAALNTLSDSGAVDPTVEAPSNSIPFPLCWMKADYGQNVVTWQRIPGGHDGPWAMRLTMTSHRSGAAKLIQQFDTGQCSIPVVPGQSYDLGTWYKSTATTQFSVYYRIPEGRWLYWTSSPFYRATSRWTHATWTTPPLPANGSGLSFGLTLDSKGSLITDDYSVRATPLSITRRILDITIVAVLVLGGAAAAPPRTAQRRLLEAFVQQPVANGEGRRFEPGMHPELGEQRLDVRPHRSGRDPEFPRDGRGIQACHQEHQALPLARGEVPGEPVRVVLVRQRPLPDALRDVDDHLAAQHPFNGLGQRRDPPGLVQVPGGPDVQRLPYPLSVGVRAEHQDLGLTADGEHLGDRLDAVVPGEVTVDQAHVRLHPADGLDGGGGAAGHRDLVPALDQDRRHRVEEHAVVIPDHQAGHRVRPLIPPALPPDGPGPGW